MSLRAMRALGCVGAILAWPGWTQTAPPQDVTLVLGRGELIQFAGDIARVAVSEPKIADAVVVSPREVMMNAKAIGRSTIVVWEASAVMPRRYEVNVLADRSDFDGVLKSISAQLPDSQIVVTGNTETIVLTGKARDAAQAKQAEALAATHAKKVLNLLDVPPAPEPRQILLQVRFASVDRVGLSELGFNYFSRNDKTLGGISTQQFQQPRFSQLQFQDQAFSNSSINFADLLNLFVFRPDLNIGATIKALQSRNLLQILAEPNLITLEGKEANFLA
ncbi:MAG: pilus assembly protein N-terminal domain-containing protein, partial [Bryobacterales bacterium]|nr:pilus assembly protein N-terminal domain-containing protein [Bryobacterales bacterium]